MIVFEVVVESVAPHELEVKVQVVVHELVTVVHGTTVCGQFTEHALPTVFGSVHDVVGLPLPPPPPPPPLPPQPNNPHPPGTAKQTATTGAAKKTAKTTPWATKITVDGSAP